MEIVGSWGGLETITSSFKSNHTSEKDNLPQMWDSYSHLTYQYPPQVWVHLFLWVYSPSYGSFFTHIYLHHCLMASTKHGARSPFSWRFSIQGALVKLGSDTIVGSWGGLGIITYGFKSNHTSDKDTTY